MVCVRGGGGMKEAKRPPPQTSGGAASEEWSERGGFFLIAAENIWENRTEPELGGGDWDQNGKRKEMKVASFLPPDVHFMRLHDSSCVKKGWTTLLKRLHHLRRNVKPSRPGDAAQIIVTYSRWVGRLRSAMMEAYHDASV